jgi:hypothetical protein
MDPAGDNGLRYACKECQVLRVILQLPSASLVADL